MIRIKTKENQFRDLLVKYKEAERGIIYEFSGNFEKSLCELGKELASMLNEYKGRKSCKKQ